jgi:broad specificity phosphatase PhoE
MHAGTWSRCDRSWTGRSSCNLQTAAPIAEAVGAVTRVDEGFVDRDYAQWVGVAADEIAATFGTLDAAPGAEPPAAFARRVRDRWEEVAAELAGEAYVVVTHDAVCRCILGGVLGDPGTPATAISQRTGCWNRLELRAGRWHAMVVDALPGDGRRPGPTPLPHATEPHG